MTTFKKYRNKERGEIFDVCFKHSLFHVYFTDDEWFSKIPTEILSEEDFINQYEEVKDNDKND